MTVTLDDGRVVRREVAHPPGHDKNPLSDAHLRDKFNGLAVPAIGEERAGKLWERVSRLETDATPQDAIGFLVF